MKSIFVVLLTLVSCGSFNRILNNGLSVSKAKIPELDSKTLKIKPKLEFGIEILSTFNKVFKDKDIFFSTITKLPDQLQGGRSIVFKATMINQTTGLFISNVILKTAEIEFRETIEENEIILHSSVRKMNQLQTEFKLLKDFDRPDLPRAYFGKLHDYSDHYFKKYTMILKYIEGRTLSQYLKQVKSSSIEDAKFIIKSLAKTLNDLHNLNIYHRDIKPDNIIIPDDFSVTYSVPVLIDFGLHDKATSDDLTKSERRGSFGFIPPFIIFQNKLDTNDVFALGIIFVEILSGQRHLSLNKNQAKYDSETGMLSLESCQAFRRIAQSDQFLMNRIADFSNEDASAAVELVSRMLREKPSFTMKQVIDHRFLN